MTNKLTPEEATIALAALPTDDPEVQHLSADVILCQLLNFLGQEEIVDQYKAMAVDWEYS